MRSLDHAREDWRAHQLEQAKRAEHECHGFLIRREREAEFHRRYGYGFAALARLFRRPWNERVRYATPELVDFWDRHGHITFEQWGYAAGFRHKFLVQARRRRYL